MSLNSYRYLKSHRLLKPCQFKEVFDNTAFKAHQPHIMVFVAANRESHARLGMAVTKKKLPTAVARNLLKRLIRERFRLRFKQLPTTDLVFTVKKPTKQLTNEQLIAEIDCLLDKVCQKLKEQ